MKPEDFLLDALDSSKPDIRDYLTARHQMSIKDSDIGAIGDGAANDEAALAAGIAEWIAAPAGETELLIPHGTYAHSGLRQLINPGSELRGIGRPRFKYTGASGPAISISSAGNNYYDQVVRNLMIQGTATAQGLLYLHKLHQSLLENIELRDMNPSSSYAAFASDFMVSNIIRRLSVSANRGAFTVGAVPYIGVYLGSGTASETQTINNIFEQLEIDGTGGTGLVLINALENTFLSGAVQACGNPTAGSKGVHIGVNCHGNLFINFFCEQNGEVSGVAPDEVFAGPDFLVQGDNNILFNCTGASNTDSLIIEATARNTIVRGGRYRKIANAGVGTSFENVSVIASGGYTDTGSRTTRRNMYNETDTTWYVDQLPLPDAVALTGFTNSWLDYGSPLPTSAYRRTADGYIQMQGGIKSGTVGAGTPAFLFPVGSRPPGNVYFTLPNPVDQTNVQVRVTVGGELAIITGTNTGVALDGIRFTAVN